MNFSEDQMNEKPVIIIEEKADFIPGQGEGETPIISIESDDQETENQHPRKQSLRWLAGIALAFILFCIAALFGYKYYRTYMNIGIPVSVKSDENIEKLKKAVEDTLPEVVMTSDSILGVGMNFYEIRGLKAEITLTEPDSTDTDVYLYSRSCDNTTYDPETNHYLGSLVINGKEIEHDVSRLGYCAMANGNIVIGVARDEKVKDYCISQGGAFFRQFILVSNGVLPRTFYLHGKVERRAIGRMGSKLYYIESRHKETMWDFADAIREYGFIDAIYITGGTDYSFYRSADGTTHGIGDISKYEEKHKGAGIVPWVVFKKR